MLVSRSFSMETPERNPLHEVWHVVSSGQLLGRRPLEPVQQATMHQSDTLRHLLGHVSGR